LLEVQSIPGADLWVHVAIGSALDHELDRGSTTCK
jgi:hypothetical protein